MRVTIQLWILILLFIAARFSNAENAFAFRITQIYANCKYFFNILDIGGGEGWKRCNLVMNCLTVFYNAFLVAVTGATCFLPGYSNTILYFDRANATLSRWKSVYIHTCVSVCNFSLYIARKRISRGYGKCESHYFRRSNRVSSFIYFQIAHFRVFLLYFYITYLESKSKFLITVIIMQKIYN